MTTSARVDRASLVRRALVELVAERGLRGASMNAVAQRAGVATGTAYVHYNSKDDLILAAYREVKRNLGRAAVAGHDPAAPPAEQFRLLWHRIYDHLAEDSLRARFLVQIDTSPIAAEARGTPTTDDELLAVANSPDFSSLLVELPPGVLYDLGIGPAVRLAASQATPGPGSLDRVARACWRAITRPGS